MMLQLLQSNSRSTRYADIGSGDLYFARRLRMLTDASICAIDTNYTELHTEPQITTYVDITQVRSASIDCALLMDVIEHVEDDVGLLRQTDRILTSGARVVITAPAHAFLWSEHDTFLKHYRRYSHARLSAVVRRAGFEIIEVFHFFGIPFLARAATVGLSNLGMRRHNSGTVGRWPYPDHHLRTRTLRTILNADFRMSRRLGAGLLAGLGLSICTVCRRAFHEAAPIDALPREAMMSVGESSDQQLI
jgi:hypothetical protein